MGWQPLLSKLVNEGAGLRGREKRGRLGLHGGIESRGSESVSRNIAILFLPKLVFKCLRLRLPVRKKKLLHVCICILNDLL